jgi:hypothetical protein
VIAGSELTYNPGACAEPAPPPGGKCRVHVNALGVTARPAGKLEWADRAATTRRAMYAAALAPPRARRRAAAQPPAVALGPDRRRS